MSVSMSCWTLSVAVAMLATPVSSTMTGDDPAFDSRISAYMARTFDARAATPPGGTAGIVAIYTHTLDLEKLALSDFGDEPPHASR